MSDVINLELLDMRKMGDDIRLLYNATQIQGKGED